MASIKLPPRQRMINMMYLVLTAMLAMNVSKEVLDAFAVLDADLVRSERAHEQRSRIEYAAFDEAARKFPERYKALDEQAHRVEAHADSLVSRIERIKARVIGEVEDRGMHELIGKDGAGEDSLLALVHVQAKDDRDVLTRLLVGSEPAEPRKGEGSASELRMEIARFRDELKELCAARGPELASALDVLFDLSPRKDASGTLNNWESINFYEVPLAAGIAHLTKLQADVRSAENDIVKWLYRSASADAIIVSDMTSAVIPRSTVVMVGDSFVADVFLAAYDRKNRPRITTASGDVLPLGADGKGKLRLKAQTIGEQTASGIISYEGPKGTEEHPYNISYQVMAPLFVASPTKMNVLYRGVENPVSFSVPGVAPENVRPTIDNGQVRLVKGAWSIKVDRLGTARMNAVVSLPDGSVRTIGPVDFRVRDLPPPVADLNGITSSDNKAPLSKVLSAKGIGVKRAEACEFDEKYVVTRYTITVPRHGNAIPWTVRGNAFDVDARKRIDLLRAGDRLFVEDIYARLANGEGPEYKLPAIVVTVK